MWAPKIWNYINGYFAYCGRINLFLVARGTPWPCFPKTTLCSPLYIYNDRQVVVFDMSNISYTYNISDGRTVFLTPAVKKWKYLHRDEIIIWHGTWAKVANSLHLRTGYISRTCSAEARRWYSPWADTRWLSRKLDHSPNCFHKKLGTLRKCCLLETAYSYFTHEANGTAQFRIFKYD